MIFLLVMLAVAPEPPPAPASLAPLVERLSSGFPAPPLSVTSVGYDTATHLARWCFGACGQIGGGYAAVEREDVAPAQYSAMAVQDASIGLTYAQLLTSFKSDANFAGKLVHSDASGAVDVVQKTDKDPPPSKYDHGYQTTTTHYYAVRDGLVVAHGWVTTEN